MKYIDSELLRKEIEKNKNMIDGLFTEGDDSVYDGENDAYNRVLRIIDSLQQEPLIHTELCTLIACDIIQSTAKRAIEKPQDKDKEEDLMIKKMEYLNMLEKSFFQQEKPEVDLEKEIKDYWEKICDDEFGELIPRVRETTWFDNIARHFYELGRKAKEDK